MSLGAKLKRCREGLTATALSSAIQKSLVKASPVNLLMTRLTLSVFLVLRMLLASSCIGNPGMVEYPTSKPTPVKGEDGESGMVSWEREPTDRCRLRE